MAGKACHFVCSATRVGLIQALGAQPTMTHVLGLTLIWVSWLYVMVAVLYARSTYRKMVKAHPEYFSDVQSKLTRALNWDSSFGIMKFIGDSGIERGYDSQLAKNIRISKMLYLGAPLAFILFVVGIFLR